MSKKTRRKPTALSKKEKHPAEKKKKGTKPKKISKISKSERERRAKIGRKISASLKKYPKQNKKIVSRGRKPVLEKKGTKPKKINKISKNERERRAKIGRKISASLKKYHEERKKIVSQGRKPILETKPKRLIHEPMIEQIRKILEGVAYEIGKGRLIGPVTNSDGSISADLRIAIEPRENINELLEDIRDEIVIPRGCEVSVGFRFVASLFEENQLSRDIAKPPRFRGDVENKTEAWKALVTRDKYTNYNGAADVTTSYFKSHKKGVAFFTASELILERMSKYGRPSEIVIRFYYSPLGIHKKTRI